MSIAHVFHQIWLGDRPLPKEYAEYQRRTSPVIPWFPRRVREGAPRTAG